MRKVGSEKKRCFQMSYGVKDISMVNGTESCNRICVKMPVAGQFFLRVPGARAGGRSGAVFPTILMKCRV